MSMSMAMSMSTFDHAPFSEETVNYVFKTLTAPECLQVQRATFASWKE